MSCSCGRKVQLVFTIHNAVNGNKLPIGECCVWHFDGAAEKHLIKAKALLKTRNDYAKILEDLKNSSDETPGFANYNKTPSN
jgi:hypothetical protein